MRTPSAQRPKAPPPRPRKPHERKPSARRSRASSPKPRNGAPPPPEPTLSEEAAYRVGDAAEFGRNMAKVATRSRDLLSAFVKSQTGRTGREPLDPLNITGAYYSLFKDMAANPGRVLNAQFGFWKDYMTLVQRSTERAMGRSGRARRDAGGQRPALPRQGLAREPGLRLHQAVLPARGEQPAQGRHAGQRRPITTATRAPCSMPVNSPMRSRRRISR